MKNLLGKLAMIGSTYVATAFGGDLTNKHSSFTNVAGYTAQLPANPSPALLRMIDDINQRKLGHATNVWVYNPKSTNGLEKKRIWVRPEVEVFGGYRTSKVAGYTVDVRNDTNAVPDILRQLPAGSYAPLSDAEMLKIRGSPNARSK